MLQGVLIHIKLLNDPWYELLKEKKCHMVWYNPHPRIRQGLDCIHFTEEKTDDWSGCVNISNKALLTRHSAFLCPSTTLM